jgi:hypothetical protein
MFEPSRADTAEFAALRKVELAKWSRVVKETRIRLD